MMMTNHTAVGKHSFLVATSEREYHPAIKKKRQMRKLIADRIISDELIKGKGT